MITQIIRDEIANQLIQQPNKITQTKSAADITYETYLYIRHKLGLEINNNDIHTLQIWEKKQPNPQGYLHNILTICVLPQHIIITTNTKQHSSYTLHDQNSIQNAIQKANTIIQKHLDSQQNVTNTNNRTRNTQTTKTKPATSRTNN